MWFHFGCFKSENNLVGTTQGQQVQVAAIRVTSQSHSVFIFGEKGLAKQRHMYCMVDPDDGKGLGKGSYGKPLYCVALDIGRA